MSSTDSTSKIIVNLNPTVPELEVIEGSIMNVLRASLRAEAACTMPHTVFWLSSSKREECQAAKMAMFLATAECMKTALGYAPTAAPSNP